MVHPVVLGQGKKLFKEGSTPVDLALIETRKAGPDVQLLIYRPTNRPGVMGSPAVVCDLGTSPAGVRTSPAPADGADVLLIHAGVTDRRSWHHVVDRLAYAAPMRCVRHAQLRRDNV